MENLSKRINIGLWINIGHAQKLQSYGKKNPSNSKISVGHGKNSKRAFNKAVGPEKNPKLINVGPTCIPV